MKTIFFLLALSCAAFAQQVQVKSSTGVVTFRNPAQLRSDMGLAASGANTDLDSLTPAGGTLLLSTGSGANTASINVGTVVGMVRVTAQALNFRASPTTGGNGLVFQDNAGTNTAQIYNITGSSTYLDFDTALTFRAGYSGGTVAALGASRLTMQVPIKAKGYTVATLPAGSVGDSAYVTDATAPTYNGALTGGGAVTVPVFYNGSAWVSH